MSTSARIDAFNPVQVDTTRTRQTAPPATPFRDVLAGGANVLMTGAEVATGVIGGPVLAAAVREAKTDVVGGIGGAPSSVAGGGTLGSTVGGTLGDAASTAAAMGTGAGGSDMASMRAMQRESQAFNLQLLNLQEDVQNESRRFTTVSNVVKAKYDTAMNAVRNIHS